MWKDDIKMNLREMGFGVQDWIYLAQDDPYSEILVFCTFVKLQIIYILFTFKSHISGNL
jgi:hypothetical protein